MKNVAVILAGGVGSRLGADKPKQFLEIGGRMVIERSVDAFERHEGIDKDTVFFDALGSFLHGIIVPDLKGVVRKRV